MGTRALEGGEISSLSSRCQVVQAESAKHQPLEAHSQKPSFLSTGIFLSILLRHLSLHFCMCVHLSECLGHMCCVHIHTCTHVYGGRIMEKRNHCFLCSLSQVGRYLAWKEHYLGEGMLLRRCGASRTHCVHSEGGVQTPSAMQTPTQRSPLHNWFMHVKKQPLRHPGNPG